MSTLPISRYLRRAFQDFSGGLNDRESPLIIKANEFVDLENAIVNDRGLLEKAKGYITDGDPFPNDADSFARMMVNYKRGTTVDKLVVAAQDDGNAHASLKVDLKATSGDGVYSYIGYTTGTAQFTNASTAVVGTGTAWLTKLKAGDKIKADSHADSVYAEIASVTNDTNLVLSAVYTGATTLTVAYTARIMLHKDFIPSACTFNDNLVITNGSESPMSYNNTTLGLITDSDTPKCKFIEPHKSRVFVASTSGAPSSIFWSAVNDETTWDATSVEPVFPKDGGNICGIKSFADSLIVLKDNGHLYQIVGSFDQDAAGSPDAIRKIDAPESIGVIAGRTAVVCDDNKLYFLAKSGWYALDSRMGIKKVSWNIDTLTSSIVIAPGPSQNKSFVYDTQTQWETGAHSGTRSNTSGTLQSVFDTYSITDAYQKSDCVAVHVDSAGVIHVAYLLNSNQKVIKYAKWALDGTKTEETALTHILAIEKLCMDVAPNGNVGIMFREASNISFVERSAGAWGSADSALGGSWTQFAIKYKSTNVCCFAGLAVSGANSNLYFGDRSGSAFPVNLVYTSLANNQSSTGFSMVLTAADNPVISFLNSATVVRTTSSADGGASFALAVDISATATRYSSFDVTSQGHNGLSDRLVVYGDNGAIKERNVTTSATRTLDSSTDRLVGYSISSDKRFWVQLDSSGTETVKFETSHTAGTAAFTNGNAVVTGTGTQWSTWLAVGDVIKRSTHADSVYGTVQTVDSDTQVTLTAVYGGATSSGTYISRRSGSVANPSTASASTTFYPGKQGVHSNGTVMGIAMFSSSAENILVRRVAPFSVWTGPEQSDSTLTAWSTFNAVDSNANGNTVIFQVALNTVSPVVTYNTIINDSLVSTTAANVYVRTKWYVTLAAWSGSDVGSITLNYVGAGVDAKQPVGVLFENEYYTAITESGQLNNNLIVLKDKAESFTTLTPNVSAMCMYKNKLYAGLATRGRVIKLQTGYNQSSVAYTMTATSKEDFLGSLELEKEAYKVYVLYEVQAAGSFVFSYRTDNFTSATPATWTDTTVTQTEAGIWEVPVIKPFKSIQFKVSNSGLDNQVAVLGYVVVYGYLNLR